jgi:6-pyruvoyltetrahydropterin/6-carboxytetrahydropterin synthase
MGRFVVGRKYRFSASHRLHAAGLSAEENARIYGKCNHPYGHGHDYVLEVVMGGEASAETGLVVELGKLDGLIRERVLAVYDHKFMNAEVERFMEGEPPTTELVAEDIYRRLRESWPQGFPELEAVRILETRRNLVEYEG